MQGKFTYEGKEKLYGLAIPGTCNSGMTASKVTLVAGELAGYGDDYFNTHYYIQIIKNANLAGNAPESEIRAITDYASSSGTFTCDAFSSNVQEADEFYILHSSIMLILSEMPDVGDWVLGDYDLFETADPDGDNERWDVGYIAGGTTGSAAIASGVYTVNSLRPSGVTSRYAGNKALPFYADFFRVSTDIDCTFGTTDSGTPKSVGILISAGTSYDSNNYIAIERQVGSSSVDRIQMRSHLTGGSEETTNVAVTDNEIAFKIERLGQTWACFYSTIQYEDGLQDWKKIGEIEDPNNYMTNQVTYYMEASNGAAGDVNETASGAFDNFYYWLGTGGGSQYVAGDYDSTWVSNDVDGSVFERIEAIQKALQIVAGGGTGFEADGTGATLYKAVVAYEGLTTSGGSTTTIVDSVLTAFATDYFNGNQVVMLQNNSLGVVSTIVDFDGTNTLTLDPALPASTSTGSVYIILNKHTDVPPTADSSNNRLTSDVVGNKADAAAEDAVTSTDSLVAYIKQLVNALSDGSIKNTMVNRDMPYLTEFWETEQLSGSVWEETLDGAGTGVFAVADGYMYYDLDTENVANSDILLNSKYRWQCRPASFSDTNTSVEKLILEWEAKITAVNADDIVNANFVMGFAETKDNDNTDNNIALFTMDGSDNFIAKIDNDSAETSSSTISATLTNWNKFRIEVYDTGYKFYLNETLQHTEETNVPDEAMYIVFGMRTDAVNGIVGLNIGNVRIWHQEVA